MDISVNSSCIKIVGINQQIKEEIPNRMPGVVFDILWFKAWYLELVTGEIDYNNMVGAGCILSQQNIELVQEARYLYRKTLALKKK